MSTTITYKNNTIATAVNQTKTLKTAGKYMEADIVVQDTTAGGSAVVVTETLDAHGGTIKEITAVDLSNDTVDAAHLATGYTAHDCTGTAITGTYSGGGGTINNQNKTVTPTESQQQVTADSGYTGLGTVTVNAISSSYVGTAVPTQGATTYTPTTTNQTIASGTYLTGAQTISGDANLVAANIVSGVSIFGVSGSLVVQNYYTGSATPSSSLGNNGDIYLKTT